MLAKSWHGPQTLHVNFHRILRGAVLAAALALPAPSLSAQDSTAIADTTLGKPRIDIYGAAMLGMAYEFGQSNPNFFDVVRPTQLPAFPGQFGHDGHFIASVRPSRFGVRAFVPTSLGEVRTMFEFDLFGSGPSVGQTTFRIRHAWGELGQFGAGMTNTPFMDVSMFPNSIEFWGPSGLVWLRNVQLRWTPYVRKDGSDVQVALLRPGATIALDDYADHIDLSGVNIRLPAPDIAAHFRQATSFGHVQLAGILRYIAWEDADPTNGLDIDGDALAWGFNLSSAVRIQRHVARMAVVYGHGVENYVLDAPIDVGAESNPGNPLRPFVGKALPVLGVSAFLDLNWNEKYTSTVGYSIVDIDNSSGQAATAFRQGQYALANVLYHPVPQLFLGPELQWAKRSNFRDGYSADDFRIQFSMRYNFGVYVGGK